MKNYTVIVQKKISVLADNAFRAKQQLKKEGWDVKKVMKPSKVSVECQMCGKLWPGKELDDEEIIEHGCKQ